MADGMACRFKAPVSEECPVFITVVVTAPFPSTVLSIFHLTSIYEVPTLC